MPGIRSCLLLCVVLLNTGYIYGKKICEDGQADVVFLIDASGSVGAANFETVRTFLANVTGSLDISPSTTQIGLMRFESNVQHIFKLNNYTTSANVKSAIMGMGYTGGSTNTDIALEKFKDEAFISSNGGRATQPHIGIVFTDGASSNKQKTLNAAQAIHDDTSNPIIMVALGVAGSLTEELNAIATDPNDENVYYQEDFTDLESIQDEIVERLCAKTFGGLILECITAECEAMGGLGNNGNTLAGNVNVLLPIVIILGVMQRMLH